ncbi:M56 family metallopeptidase [Actinomadura parmotrematis]|uniref:M56 family metallopeptidase n=1 Tax=Actinomadura parmotrematis TaxID=2864039 RepID=A0ABS7FN65_9ACTN|nr:M56 family metallopeptidase [Actinomadura parmotrematis]MBW8481834.1 M56 family metallopeptidase [Actinomadura parmotrematis]
MHLAVYLPLLPPVAAALSARWLAARLDPRAATWLLTAAALLLAAASTTALGLLAIAGLVRIPLVASLGRLSRTALAGTDPTARLVSLAAGLALSAAALTAARALWHRGRALLAAAREARRLPGTGDVVILDGPADAYTLPGAPGRIVVSTRMLAGLTGPERGVLIAHERVHLHARHHWFAAATRLAASLNPLLRPLERATAYTIERWADEHAARGCGDRRLVARTVAKAALLRAGGPRRAVTALGIAGAELAAGGPLPRRVAALMAAPPRRRLPLIAAVAAVLLLTGLCTAEAAGDLEDLLEAAGA